MQNAEANVELFNVITVQNIGLIKFFSIDVYVMYFIRILWFILKLK